MKRHPGPRVSGPSRSAVSLRISRFRPVKTELLSRPRARIPPCKRRAATANYLRTREHGATYEPTSHVTVAGFTGIQFDGKISAKEHQFIAFTPQQNIARYYGDGYYIGKGEVFRISVLQVKRKSVVVYIENADLPVDQFPAFLTRADELLKTVKFPG